jgi:hypothetical protein
MYGISERRKVFPGAVGRDAKVASNHEAAPLPIPPAYSAVKAVRR